MASKTEMEKVLENVRKDFQAMLEFQASVSILYRAKFDALVRMKFTEEQALELVKARGISP